MRKAFKLIGFLILLACLVFAGTVISDKAVLRQNVVRLHVVAASDSREDQSVKLQVKDAVLSYLQAEMKDLPDARQAKEYLQQQIPKLQQIANGVLKELGRAEEAVVSFLQEAFPTKSYDTFQLPEGVYDALKITIGEGEGENWWCVVFPAFCMQPAAEGISDVAAGAGFPQALTDTLTQENGYEVRFFFLEVLGRLENLFS